MNEPAREKNDCLSRAKPWHRSLLPNPMLGPVVFTRGRGQETSDIDKRDSG